MKVVALCLFCVTVTVYAVTECPSYHGVGVLKVGEEKTVPGTCTLAICNEDGGISKKACSEFIEPPNCEYVPEDLSKPYPECCPTFRCPL
ncbi:venom peptide HsVx1-like isoform X2 [Diabrotica virgifera virgifera]|nr:venom peptide HsVx1-like isoform X2 [Diabrotica virgifera virgifera]XP_050499353.1 venom peptide HsVx1-like isoform X2 [Diabrotica virgifera virgifera]